jgi:predicted nucleic acid-binding protein
VDAVGGLPVLATIDAINTVAPLILFIAAHAKSPGLTLITDNTAEFSRIEGLALENWAT